MKYTDKNGTWERTTFTSLADGVTVTKIEKSSKNAPVNITLSYDDISTMANYSEGDEVNIKYKKLADEGKAYLALVAHYPDYEKSELKNGGYATLTYVLNIGGTLSVTQADAPKDEQYAGDSQPKLTVSGADEVYLITVTGRDYNMASFPPSRHKAAARSSTCSITGQRTLRKNTQPRENSTIPMHLTLILRYISRSSTQSR